MNVTTPRVWMLILALSAGLALSCSSSPEEMAQTKAREYTHRFYDGDLAALHQLFTPEMAQEIPFAQFVEMKRGVTGQLGKETEVVSERVEVKGPYFRYQRRARFERRAGEIEINWLLRDDDHRIAGVVFSPIQAPAQD